MAVCCARMVIENIYALPVSAILFIVSDGCLLCPDGCLFRPDSYWECSSSSARLFIVSGWLFVASGWLLGMFTRSTMLFIMPGWLFVASGQLLGMYTLFCKVVYCVRMVVCFVRTAIGNVQALPRGCLLCPGGCLLHPDGCWECLLAPRCCLLCPDGCLLRPDSYWECLRPSARLFYVSGQLFIASGWLLEMFTRSAMLFIVSGWFVAYRIPMAIGNVYALLPSEILFVASGWLLGMFTHFHDVVDCVRVVVYRLRVALTWSIDLRDAFCANRKVLKLTKFYALGIELRNSDPQDPSFKRKQIPYIPDSAPAMGRTRSHRTENVEYY
jgi:hypothetical protein